MNPHTHCHAGCTAWEGAVAIRGMHAGVAYVELTGYEGGGNIPANGGHPDSNA